MYFSLTPFSTLFQSLHALITFQSPLVVDMCILTEVIVVIYEGSVFWGDHCPKTEAGLSFSTSYHDFSLSAGIAHLFRYVVQFSTRTFNIYVLVIVKSLSI